MRLKIPRIEGNTTYVRHFSESNKKKQRAQLRRRRKVRLHRCSEYPYSRVFGVYNVFRNASTESIAVLTAEILRVLPVSALTTSSTVSTRSIEPPNTASARSTSNIRPCHTASNLSTSSVAPATAIYSTSHSWVCQLLSLSVAILHRSQVFI